MCEWLLAEGNSTNKKFVDTKRNRLNVSYLLNLIAFRQLDTLGLNAKDIADNFECLHVLDKWNGLLSSFISMELSE